MSGTMFYRHNDPVELGDRVNYNGQLGRVVFVRGSKLENPRFPSSVWLEAAATILIEFDNGALLNLQDADDRCLEFVSK